MTMRKALHFRDDKNRLYVSLKESGIRFASTEDSVDASTQRLEDNIKKRKGRKTDYSDLEQYIQQKHQQNKNNQKTRKKKKRKTIGWTFQTINKRIFTRENMDMAEKRETLREKLNHSWWQHKTMPYGLNMSKQKTQQNSRCR